ncbi:MAG: Ig-like domain-containing protein [Candidatus Shapirobacteria bacterium]
MKPNKYLIIIGFLSLALIASLFLVVQTTNTYNRAATSKGASIVLENSYLFASPLQAKADGQEQIRLTVFLLDGRGLGVPNQSVNLDLPNSITITNNQTLSDESGKVVFDIVSSIPQSIYVTATANKNKLPQKVKINFY